MIKRILFSLILCFSSIYLFGETVRDEFEAISVSNNDGTVNWTGDWQEIGESDGSAVGKCLISTDEGGRLSMQIGGSSKGWSRAADLSMAETAELSFLYLRKGLEDVGEGVILVFLLTEEEPGRR